MSLSQPLVRCPNCEHDNWSDALSCVACGGRLRAPQAQLPIAPPPGPDHVYTARAVDPAPAPGPIRSASVGIALLRRIENPRTRVIVVLSSLGIPTIALAVSNPYSDAWILSGMALAVVVTLFIPTSIGSLFRKD